jgi:uncharacterized protein YjbI with pentapeptide repeats
MPKDNHLAQLMKGVAAWNAWRDENPTIRPDLSEANLVGANLGRADLFGADLSKASLAGADLSWADLSEANLAGVKLPGANLRKATLFRAHLGEANLNGAKVGFADLRMAYLFGATLRKTNLFRTKLASAYLDGADLREAILFQADLTSANLSDANLSNADLRKAILFASDLRWAKLVEAKLDGADLHSATLVETDLTGAVLTGCRVYGVSAWGLKLEKSKQHNLTITSADEPEITVDNIEVAQFIYLLLHNKKIRAVIDTITSKAVLILGRFTAERKSVLDAIRGELRKRDYLPILFDFERPKNPNTDETITLLARMAKFIIADITDAKSVLQELRGIVPDLPSVPVQPIILAMQEEPGMFDFYQNMQWFLPVHRYTTQEQLLVDLDEKVIGFAELKLPELRAETAYKRH